MTEVSLLDEPALGCRHAETTTLLWLYGEADEAHAEHVAGCAECQDTAATHEAVLARTQGLWPEVGRPAPYGRSASSLPPRFPVVLRWALPVLALAAAALVVVRPMSTPLGAGPGVAALPIPELAPLDADLDRELDALQADLEDAELDWFFSPPSEVP